ncbi:MAG: cell wall-binding repeat-containing protein [Euzebya sp.]
MRHFTIFAVALLLTLATAGAGPATAQSEPTVRRLAGTTRIETAIAISVDSYDTDQASAVILARSDLFPDALAGGPLAAVNNGPLLLTPPTELVQAVGDEIGRVLPDGGEVFLLGGQAALSADVEAAVAELGYAPRRLSGNSRYDTALAIARESAPAPGFITIATGNDFPDALIGGSLATAFADGVMVLTNGDQLTPSVQAYLDDNSDVDKTTIGPAAAAAFPSAFNVAGPNPSARSVVAAQVFYSRINPTGVTVASVERFPDGLAGAAHAFDAGLLPLLLTPSAELPQAHIDYITSLDASGRSYVYGGNLAVAERVVDQMRAALNS